MTRYEAREIEGRWAIYDTVENRVTGWFGRVEDERLSAAAHAREMNDPKRPAADDHADEEPISLHAAFARHQVEQERRRKRGGGGGS